MDYFIKLKVFLNGTAHSVTEVAIAKHSLFVQKPESLDPRAKYHSLTSGIGSNYTQPRQMDVDDDVSEALYVKLLEMEKAIHKRLKEEDDKQAYKKYLHQTESSFVRLFSSTDLV
ncbi:3-keto-steroid reductase/17-beta-hydroxysteroid dehydrogenase 7-like [Oncorhynchus mykiss]|uniref:3-keto-steroid reductase/17-beta-hydroxysteroid dehydrogenase 7-like n=1 Tax=Oncorhynchus mykiss TaxID=8022 RepID=UPI0018787C2E|nr:3-keto-steroid reductase/17-beta-hydroxysteroid dehydrogenase 7-like [Oncorhynchus mykiss]